MIHDLCHELKRKKKQKRGRPLKEKIGKEVFNINVGLFDFMLIN